MMNVHPYIWKLINILTCMRSYGYSKPREKHPNERKILNYFVSVVNQCDMLKLIVFNYILHHNDNKSIICIIYLLYLYIVQLVNI